MFYYFYDLFLKSKSNCKYNIKSVLKFIRYNVIGKIKKVINKY